MTQEEKVEFINQYHEAEKLFKEANSFIKSYENLLKNKDFKTVIMEGYFKNELFRLVESQKMFTKKSTPQTIEWSKEQDKIIQDKLLAISNFKEYLDDIKLKHKLLEKDMNDLKKEYEEVITSLNEEV